MDAWGWFVAYLLLFALFHIVLYAVYVRRSNADESNSKLAGEPGPGRPTSGGRRAARRREIHDPSEFEDVLQFDGATVDCAYCGAQNEADPAFGTCWNCTSPLQM
ncbi:MAG: DUF7577 domain-containing protein [Halobacteriota archaeon]